MYNGHVIVQPTVTCPYTGILAVERVPETCPCTANSGKRNKEMFFYSQQCDMYQIHVPLLAVQGHVLCLVHVLV